VSLWQTATLEDEQLTRKQDDLPDTAG